MAEHGGYLRLLPQLENAGFALTQLETEGEMILARNRPGSVVDR
jgi:hypothetical protein